jgi:hypothetical protein
MRHYGDMKMSTTTKIKSKGIPANFGLARLRWSTLDEATDYCIKTFRRRIRSLYPAEWYDIECGWVPGSQPLTSGSGANEFDAVEVTGIWDLRGKRPKPIEGRLVCMANPKPGSPIFKFSSVPNKLSVLLALSRQQNKKASGKRAQ